MKKTTWMFVLTLILWAISAWFASSVDSLSNIQQHLGIYEWLGYMSVALGSFGVIVFARYLYCSFNNTQMGISGRGWH